MKGVKDKQKKMNAFATKFRTALGSVRTTMEPAIPLYMCLLVIYILYFVTSVHSVCQCFSVVLDGFYLIYNELWVKYKHI